MSTIHIDSIRFIIITDQTLFRLTRLRLNIERYVFILDCENRIVFHYVTVILFSYVLPINLVILLFIHYKWSIHCFIISIAESSQKWLKYFRCIYFFYFVFFVFYVFNLMVFLLQFILFKIQTISVDWMIEIDSE